MIPNKFNCSKKLWGKMSALQRRFYNEMRSYPQDIICPLKINIDEKEWDVISHNFSYLAASNLDLIKMVYEK